MRKIKIKIIGVFLVMVFLGWLVPFLAKAEAKKYGEANLGCGLKDAKNRCLGPQISIGLWSISKKDLARYSFKIKANKDFVIKDNDGKDVMDIIAEQEVKIKYNSDENKLRIYGENITETLVSAKKVYFQPKKSADASTIVFDVNKPNSDFDRYRGEMVLDLYNVSGSSKDLFWVINRLPLEQYVWGMGEIKGTGPVNHNRVMTTAYRTYGYWKIKFSTKYAKYGFIVDGTSKSQIYYGYDWEIKYPRIRDAAENTWGRLVMYKKEIAITPYSSWTDGKTRSFPDGHWGRNCKKKPTGKISKDYPWVVGVKDPYGKNKYSNTCDLAKAGNHMVGLSANGSLKLAGDKYKWKWDKILKYYFKKVSIYQAYK